MLGLLKMDENNVNDNETEGEIKVSNFGALSKSKAVMSSNGDLSGGSSPGLDKNHMASGGEQVDVDEGYSGSQDFPDLSYDEYLGFSIDEVTEDLTGYGGIEQRYPKYALDVLMQMTKGNTSTAEGNGNFWESYCWPIPSNEKESFPSTQAEADSSFAKLLKSIKSELPDNIVIEPVHHEEAVVKAEDGDASGGNDVSGFENQQKKSSFLNHETSPAVVTSSGGDSPSQTRKNNVVAISAIKSEVDEENMSEETFKMDLLTKFEEFSGCKLFEDEPYKGIYDFEKAFLASPLGSDGEEDFPSWNDIFMEGGLASNKRLPISVKEEVSAVGGVRKIEITTSGAVSTEIIKAAQDQDASATLVQGRKEEFQLQDDRICGSGFEESGLLSRRRKRKMDHPSASLPRGAKRSVHEIIIEANKESQNSTAAGAEGEASGKPFQILIPVQDLSAALRQKSFVMCKLGGKKVIRFTDSSIVQDVLKTASFRTTNNAVELSSEFEITPVSPAKLNHNVRKTPHVLMTPKPKVEMMSPVPSPVKDENSSFNSSLSSLSSLSTTSSKSSKKKKSKSDYTKEKMRRLDLSKSFKDLQKCIPSIASIPKCSKSEILTSSQELINELKALEHRLQKEKMHYKKRNAQLKATLEKAKLKV